MARLDPSYAIGENHMRSILFLAMTLFPLAMAQAEGMPPACTAAAQPAAPADHAMTHDAASHGAMQMHDAMAQAATISDPDLAFNCGMIAHHQGAIDMAETELKAGKDPASLALARQIIDAQKREIAEMTAWVVQHAAGK